MTYRRPTTVESTDVSRVFTVVDVLASSAVPRTYITMSAKIDKISHFKPILALLHEYCAILAGTVTSIEKIFQIFQFYLMKCNMALIDLLKSRSQTDIVMLKSIKLAILSQYWHYCMNFDF